MEIPVNMRQTALLSVLLFVASSAPAFQVPYTYHIETILGADLEKATPALEWNFNDLPMRFALEADGSLLILDTADDGNATHLQGGRVVLKRLTSGLLVPVPLRVDSEFCFSGVTTISVSKEVAAAPDGRVYLSEPVCRKIYRVMPDGKLEPFAGKAGGGYSPDEIPAKDAAFSEIHDIAADAEGNVFVIDANRVRRIDRQGIIHLFAGGGQIDADGVPATTAILSRPHAVAVDSTGNVFVAETWASPYKIRKITRDGIISTFYRSSYLPAKLAVDRAGNVYLDQGYPGSVVRLARDGNASIIPNTANPYGLGRGFAVSPSGQIYLDRASYEVSVADQQGNLRRVAGTGQSALQAGVLKYTRLSGVWGVAVDVQGMWVLSTPEMDFIDPAGKRTRLLSGLGFDAPVFDATHSLYYVNNFSIWRLNSARNGAVEFLAGPNGFSLGDRGDGGPATTALFNSAKALAVDREGSVLVADIQNHRIRRIDAKTATIGAAYGSAIEGDSGDGGPASEARFRLPSGLAFDRQGNLYIADASANRIRKVDTTGRISTIAGNGVLGRSGDGGPSTQALLDSPGAMAIDPLGNIYFAEGGSRIRMIDRQGRTQTIAGTAILPHRYSPDGTPALDADLPGIYGLFVGDDGAVYITHGRLNFLTKLIPENTEFPRVPVAGVLDGAGFQSGAVAPGMILALKGSNLGPATLLRAGPAGGLFPTRLEGTSVLFDGVPAPLLYTWSGQIGVMVPYSLAGKSKTTMVVDVIGARSAAVTLDVLPARPSLFTADSSGTGPGAILNQDGSLNTKENPAEGGSIIVLYGTGEGQTSPPGRDGRIAPANEIPPKPVLLVSVNICDAPADILYAGGAPLAVAGLFQVNARVPAACSGKGVAPVVLRIGSAASSPNVTVAVR